MQIYGRASAGPACHYSKAGCDTGREIRRTTGGPPAGVDLRKRRVVTQLGCVVSGGVPEADYCVRLGTFLALNDVELDLIALFQSLVSVQLDGGIVNEYIRPVIASNESVALGVVEPLDLPFVLSHRLLLSCIVRRVAVSVLTGERLPL